MPNSRARAAFFSPGGDTLLQPGDLFGGKRTLAALIGFALFGKGDAFALTFADQGTLEFTEGPMTESRSFAVGESSRVKVKPSLTNSMRTSRMVSLFTRARRSSRLRASRSMLRTIRVSPVAHKGQHTFQDRALRVLIEATDADLLVTIVDQALFDRLPCPQAALERVRQPGRR